MEQRAESGVYSGYPESRVSSTKLNDMDRIIVKTRKQRLMKPLLSIYLLHSPKPEHSVLSVPPTLS